MSQLEINQIVAYFRVNGMNLKQGKYGTYSVTAQKNDYETNKIMAELEDLMISEQVPYGVEYGNDGLIFFIENNDFNKWLRID